MSEALHLHGKIVMVHRPLKAKFGQVYTFKSSACGRLQAERRSNTAASLQSLKSDLRRLVAPTKRGKAASPQQQAEVVQLAEQLERENPTKNPALSPLLSGKWSLLYTGPGRQDDVDWKKRTGGVEGPFLAAFQPLTRSAVTNRGITQVIEAEAGKVQNLAEFRAFGSNGFLNVEGTVDPVEVQKYGKEMVRVDVKFTAFKIKVGVLPTLTIPLTWPKTPTGFVDTTYLDEDFRIGRGDKGSLFVTARRGKE